jgi:hypothetical protein
VYLAGDDGEITWIARAGLPAHTRAVSQIPVRGLAAFEPSQIPFTGQSLGTGGEFFVQGPYLWIGDDWAINLERAAEWQPPSVEPGQAAPLAVVCARSRQLLAAVQKLEGSVEDPRQRNVLFRRGKGLGRIIPLLSATARGRDVGLPGEYPRQGADPLLARAIGPVTVIAKACVNHNMARVGQAGRELVGLGPGLTPSGDDFLGGLFFVAHHLAATYPGDLHWEQQPARALLEWARAQTNRISHAILSDMAAGLGPEPLHDLVTSLLRGADVNRLMGEVARLIGIGHSSGWDILAGALTGTLLSKIPVRGGESQYVGI